MKSSQTTLPGLSQSGATFSPCGEYRYHLWRTWAPGPRVLWIMLNPSEADANKDDPTIRRCLGYARAWGFGGIEVVNLYAHRTPYPNLLLRPHLSDPVGPENDAHILKALPEAGIIVAAWGSSKAAKLRAGHVRSLLDGVPVHALAINKDGNPKHPLYCRKDLTPTRLES